MVIIQVISLLMSVGGVCMVGVFSTRGKDDHSGSSLPHNVTEAINNSVGAASSQHSEDNTPLGIMVI